MHSFPLHVQDWDDKHKPYTLIMTGDYGSKLLISDIDLLCPEQQDPSSSGCLSLAWNQKNPWHVGSNVSVLETNGAATCRAKLAESVLS